MCVCVVHLRMKFLPIHVIIITAFQPFMSCNIATNLPASNISLIDITNITHKLLISINVCNIFFPIDSLVFFSFAFSHFISCLSHFFSRLLIKNPFAEYHICSVCVCVCMSTECYVINHYYEPLLPLSR